MLDIGKRLKQERARLGKSQAELAAATGIAKKSQTNYELGHNSPSAEYLAELAKVGVDVLYVLTGVPAPALRTDESELLRRYRSASGELKAAALAVLGAAVSGEKKGGGVHFNAGVEQANVTNGDVTHKAPVTFNVGGSKKGKKK